MRVLNIQPTIQSKNVNKINLAKSQPQSPKPDSTGVNILFRGGNYKGALLGLGGGLITGLLVVGGAAIAGALALPAIIGGAAVVSAGLGGAALGNKIEEKIDASKKD